MPPATSPKLPSWQNFRRLPGRSPTLRFSPAVVNARLWVDDRQLVQETVRGHAQEVQRFAFADLQAVQIRRTTRGLVYNIFLFATLAVLLIPLGGTLATGSFSVRDHVVLSVVCGFCALLLLVNILRGPTCHTVLLTALGPQRLFPLSRLRQARRALDTIRAGVDAVQGALPPEEAVRLVDQAQASQRPVPPGRP